MPDWKMDLDRAAKLFAVEHMGKKGIGSGGRAEEDFALDAIEIYAGVKDLLERAWRDGHRFAAVGEEGHGDGGGDSGAAK